MSQSGAVIPGDRPEVPDRQQGHQITNAIPNSPLGTDSGEEQETGIATANTPRLGQVRRGFLDKREITSPEATECTGRGLRRTIRLSSE